MTTEFDYEMLVIGSGPAGQRAAIQAAKLRHKVAIIEKRAAVGGVCINTGTIPSKTVREAALHLSGYRERSLYGASYTVKQNITMADLLFRVGEVVRNEIDVTRHQLMRNGVELIGADAELVGPNSIRLKAGDGFSYRDITAKFIVIATGTDSSADPHIPFDGNHVFTSDDIPRLEALPKSLAVVGAGVVGLEYASIFAALGVRVTVIDKRKRLLPFVDAEIVDALAYHLRQNRVTLRLGEEVSGIDVLEEKREVNSVGIRLASGKQIVTDSALYSIGRAGATKSLGLEAANINVDERGRLMVNKDYQTSQPHIYGVGDVIGFPSLASTSMEQGRHSACHAFGAPAKHMPELFPYGIFTIPEISMVGPTEEELTEKGIPYEVGKAQYKEIARGQIIGDRTGLLKLIFHLETGELLAVHIIGEDAAELVHIGQAVMAFKGRVDYFVNTVFNYPTLAECYKTAAFDGINRLGR
jgi:NAD(P) transhydrogenase